MDIEKRLKKVELFMESLKNPNTFPKEIRDALISLGFLFFDGSIGYDAGVSGNHFENIFVKYLNKKTMLSISSLPFSYVVNSLSANTCSFVGTDLSPLDVDPVWSITLYTSGTFPGGLDLAVQYYLINPTATTFQLSTDGVNPVDITSFGVGTQYIGFY